MILPSASTIVEQFHSLKMSAMVFEMRTTYFKKESHFLIDQPTTHFWTTASLQSMFGKLYFCETEIGFI